MLLVFALGCPCSQSQHVTSAGLKKSEIADQDLLADEASARLIKNEAKAELIKVQVVHRAVKQKLLAFEPEQSPEAKLERHLTKQLKAVGQKRFSAMLDDMLPKVLEARLMRESPPWKQVQSL